jgi:mycothiol synthase
MLATLRSCPKANVRLWWARRWRRCIAAALVLSGPGGAGMVFYSPADAPGVDGAALRELVRQLIDDALGGDVTLVQGMLDPGDRVNAPVARDVGLHVLAELVYMERDLAASPPAVQDGLTWRCYGEYDDEQLMRVIAATYEGSLDCPELCGVRTMEEVIAAHKASGVFRPESWWIAQREGEAVGCILVNDVAVGAKADVVYVGVAPAWRGRGYARAMIEHASAATAERGLHTLVLAADAQNAPAMRIYRAAGFNEIARRTAYVRFAKREIEAGS